VERIRQQVDGANHTSASEASDVYCKSATLGPTERTQTRFVSAHDTEDCIGRANKRQDLSLPPDFLKIPHLEENPQDRER